MVIAEFVVYIYNILQIRQRLEITYGLNTKITNFLDHNVKIVIAEFLVYIYNILQIRHSPKSIYDLK